MAKSKSTRREFDWRGYTKPCRLLSTEQEAAFATGLLSPLLGWSRARDSARFEIRSRQAAIYDSGTMLLRIRGAEAPFVAEIDANVRLPRAQRSGAERLETWPLSSADEVSAVTKELDALKALNDEHLVGEQLPERAALHAFASAHDGRSDRDGDYIVVDTEFHYGKRRFDFVGMRHAEGVAGSAGFTTPRLVFGQLKSAGRPLAGSSGLMAHAADFAEFAQALGGTHLATARAELDELVRQKLRLGLLSETIPFRHFTEDRPEYLVVFSDVDLASPDLDGPLAEMHDRLVARHYQPELLRLAGIATEGLPSARHVPVIEADDVMTYREFKRARKQLRNEDADR